MHKIFCIVWRLALMCSVSFAQSDTLVQLCYGDCIEIPIPNEFKLLESSTEFNDGLFVGFGYWGTDSSWQGSYVSIIGCHNCQISGNIDDCQENTSSIIAENCVLYQCGLHYTCMITYKHFYIKYVFPIEKYDIFAALISKLCCLLNTE